jgi:hypothetical protein
MTNLSEEQVAEKAFELIMAFDEVSRPHGVPSRFHFLALRTISRRLCR